MLVGCKSWCRLCGKDIEKGINEIKTKYFPNICDAIKKLLLININKTDVIPTEICNECNQILYNLSNFYDRCKKTQEMYAEILYNSENLQNKNIDLNKFRSKYKLINNTQLYKLSVENIDIKYEENINNLTINECNVKSIETVKNININTSNTEHSNILQEDLCNSSGNISNHSVKQIENSPSLTPLLTTYSIYCEVCDKLFTSNRGYGIHLKIKHSTHRNPIECKYCGKSFKIMALLKKHENSHLPTNKKKFYPCKKCDKKFSSDSGLWSHIHTVHDKNRSVICEECGKGFPTSSYLKSHKLSHKMENDFQCPKCPLKLKRKKTLMIHLQTHDENFICPICGIQLNTKKTLRDHMVVHSDEKKFKCNICDKNFKREKTLNSHLILHTGLKPYECEFCKKRFSHGSNFRTHQKNSHPKELSDREAKGEKRVCKEFPKAKLLKEFNKNR